MVRFCREFLPEILGKAQVLPGQVTAIETDILLRAEAFAALDQASQHVLAVPFVEDVFGFQPTDASLAIRSAVAVVVRNSLLEEVHANNGPVGPRHLEAITTMAVGPLSHLLAARRRHPVPAPADSPFAVLPTKYPRAWACLRALADGFATGGRHGYRAPDEAPIPTLPDGDDLVEAQPSARGVDHVLFSGVDPRFDQDLVTKLRAAAAHQGLLRTSSLSRLSRNSDKLLRIIEFMLGHGAPILTTNYLLRPQDVWIRRGVLVTPDADNLLAGLRDERGLTGAHRNLVRALVQQAE